MQKLGFPPMKSLDQLKSLTSKNFSSSASFPSRPSSSSSSDSGSFANLKLTAEKLVKEQASVKTDLEMANTKLKKSMEHIKALEEKLQNAFNENAKLKVKQKEDEKLWRGLESKFSSTKTLCDQLTETLQLLAGQVQDAEKDKEFFEGKVSASSNAIDNLNQQLNSLSLKLSLAEDHIRIREKEVEELKIENEEKNKIYNEEQSRIAVLIQEKDSMLKKFEETVAADRLMTESLNSKLEAVQLELRVKDDQIKNLIAAQESLEKEKSYLQMSSSDISTKLAVSLQEIKELEGFARLSAAQLSELDRQNIMFIKKFDQLNSLYDNCFTLVQEEKSLQAKRTQYLNDHLHEKLVNMTSEKDALKSVNQELNSKIIELQKVQECVMEQLSKERQSAGETIRRLEAEIEMLLLKKNEADLSISKLEGKIEDMSDTSRLSKNKMQELLAKISALEVESKDSLENLTAELRDKVECIEALQQEKEKVAQHVDSLEKQVGQLHGTLEEKEQLVQKCNDREKKLEQQMTEVQAFLTSTESKLTEAKAQYDKMLESKQLELSRHLKEISQRNDQAINEMRKKYEDEKLEIVNMEKEKADKVVQEMETKCDQRLAECKEELKQQLQHVQEEHAALVLRIQQEYDRKEMNLNTNHSEEMKRFQIQAENELREKTMQLRNEHEVQMKALKCQHEDECRKLQEELDLQKSKEDRQRALLQLQWKVMGDKPQDDQEVNSKKEYSISSIKMRDPVGNKRNDRPLVRHDDGEDPPFLRVTQTPVSKILKKVENAETGSIMSIPKHHKKVTHHEYEVETKNGRTITKRRKTKSTVMFEDPRKQKRRNTPKAATPRSVVKGVREISRPRPSNIGDLFSEGSLNPYADDPYAFD